MDEQKFLVNFEHIVSAPNGVQQLRELTVQIAAQGGLVPQETGEKTADVLLMEIEQERQRLIRDRIIGKQKPLPDVKDSEKKFLLPGGWASARLGQLITMEYGKGLPAKKRNAEGNIPVFGSNGVVGFHNESLIEHPSIIVGRKGSSGALNISRTPCWPTDVTYYVVPPRAICLNFCHILLKSLRLEKLGKGIKPGLNRNEAYLLVTALPPLQEQKRIVEKVEQIMTFCDQLEAQQKQLAETSQKANRAVLDALADSGTEALLKENWARTYTNFDRLFRSEENIGKLKDTILQLAFRGKLVPQNPKHSPSDLFVQSIKDEVRELRYEHGVKREKAKPATYEIRLPYELPAGWSWVTFSDIGFIGRGKSKHRPRSAPELFHDGTYPFLQTGDVSGSVEGYIKNYSKKYNDKGLAQSKLWPTGTLCITIAANIAETGILSFDACFPDSVVGFIPAQSIGNPKYFEYVVRTAKSRLEDFAPSTAQKNINLTILENVLIPLPPIEELHQIVKKIEYLFSLCSLLAKHFRHACELQSNLALASVHKVVARDYELVKTTEDRKPDGKRKIIEVIIRLVDEMKKQIENTVLAKILARHERDMDAKELWEKSVLTIDEFYATLKREIKEGFIAEPDVATLKLLEGAD